MDFETHYTPEEEREREALRRELRAWLPEHVEGVGAPPDAAALAREQFDRNRAFLRALGGRGWYAPTWPAEYGGGGLSPAVARVIREELDAGIPHLENVHPPGDIGGSVAGALEHVGTDEQKRRFLPLILRGEVITWELHSEPDAGSDLPSLKSTAVRAGDQYVLNGTKAFAGGHFEADYLFFMAVTDPQGARRRNLSTFLVPIDAPGITITDMDLIAGSKKRTMIFQDVRVPVSHMVGREGEGWTAFSVGLHGALTVGIGPSLDRDEHVIAQLIEYCKTAHVDGERLSSRPDVRDVLTQAYVDFHMQRLLRLRTDWMAEAGLPITYEGAQVVLGRKLFDLELGQAIHRALGPLSMIDDPRWAPLGGDLEYFHRYAVLMVHPGGTVEIQKLRMFRGMAEGRSPD
ncbi:MAG: acyl-CoA dehydrogenase family protein [Dehalococcoidia bacterium]|nr:acyl-CoA dehydrogenase family protein [Dehalococcoidia bacterium]